MSEAFSSEGSPVGVSHEWLARSDYPYLDDQQWSSLLKVEATNGRAHVRDLLRQGQDEVIRRVSRWRDYELAFERHVLDLVTADSRSQAVEPPQPTAIAQQPPPAPAKLKPLRVQVSQFSGSESENLIFWLREIELALVAGCIRDDRQQVTFAISHMVGRAKEWALTCETTQPGCFQDWNALAAAMRTMFLPPNVAYRQRAAFLACKQGERDLYEYVQELRQLRACMAANSIPEEVMVTVFMEGLNFGSPKTALFREDPKTLEGAISIALREDHCDRQARGLPTSPVPVPAKSASTSKPMSESAINLSQVDLSTYDLSAIKAHALHVRCLTCHKMGHFQRDCPRIRSQRGHFRRIRDRSSRRGGSAIPAYQGNGRSQ